MTKQQNQTILIAGSEGGGYASKLRKARSFACGVKSIV